MAGFIPRNFFGGPKQPSSLKYPLLRIVAGEALNHEGQDDGYGSLVLAFGQYP